MLKKLFLWILTSSLLFNQTGYAQCMDAGGLMIPCPENYDPNKGTGLVGEDPYKTQPSQTGGQPSGSPEIGGPGGTIKSVHEKGDAPNTIGGTIKAKEAAEKFKQGKGKAPGGSVPSLPPVPFQNESGKPLAESSAVKFLGTSLFLNCQRQTPKAWSDMVSTYKSKTTDDMWNDSWWTLAKSIEQKFEEYKLTPQEEKALNSGGKSSDSSGYGGGGGGGFDSGEESSFGGGGGGGFGGSSSGQPTDESQINLTGDAFQDAKAKILAVKSFVKKGIARGKGKSLTLKKCSALVPSTSLIDYNSSEDTVSIVPKSTMDRRIACRSRGAETQDFPHCRKLVTWWDGFFVGKKLMETGQKVKYQMDAKDRQEDLAMDMASKNPDPLLPLKMQKAGVDDQAAVAFQNAFFLGAQYAVMQTKFNQWPDRAEIVKTCQKAVPKDTTDDPNLTAYMDWFKQVVTAFEPYAKKIQINNLLDDFKKEKEIVASCPVSPMMGAGMGMGMGMGMGGGYGSSYGSSYGGSYGSSYGSDYGGMSSTSAGEGEGSIGVTQYQNCDQLFLQNAQMDMQSMPQMPQGTGMGMGMGGMGAMGGMDSSYGSGGYGSSGYGSSGYGSSGYDSYGGGMGMGMGMGMGGMGAGEMMMGAMGGQSTDACIDVMNSGTQLILNMQSREALKMVLAQTGIEAITNLMKGMMLRKQSAKIQSLIDGLPVPDPTLDKLSQTEEDLIASVCQIAPQEPICADFSNRSNGFNSPNIDLTPPSASTTASRVKAQEQGANAVEAEMAAIAGTDLGEAAFVADAVNARGGAESKTPSVTFKKDESSSSAGDLATDAKIGEVAPAAEKAAGEEAAPTPEVGYTGGTEARAYTGSGFRPDQYKQGGGLENIAGGDSTMGFREPASDAGIAPKDSGLFKIISDRYERISKDRLQEVKSEVAK
jgi:hypothetical protein